jgi:hypothetical protein
MSSLHAALIVDADPQGLEALVYGFRGADWRITACPVPETASLLVKASGAEIVVIASRSDHDRAHALIRQIRGKEAFRTLPVLVLGPEELRKPLKESGDVDLLPLPTFVRDVLTASQLMVEAGASAAQKPGEEPSLSLPATAATTLSLIRTLCGLARSGLLQLERKGRHGEILFHEGELTAAQVLQLQGMAAIQHVLIWNDGALKVHLRPVVRRGQLHQSAQQFLEEFDRFQRDFTHAMKDIGPPATVYATNEARPQRSSDAVPAEVTPVIRLCDGQRTLSDVIDESPFRVLDTVRIVGRLVELAILVRRDPKPDSDARSTRLPLEEFWETARIVGPTTPRTPRVHGGRSKTPTPPLGTPTARAVRGESNAPVEEKGRTRKKTLEILTPLAPTPATESAPAAAIPNHEVTNASEAPTDKPGSQAASPATLATMPVTDTMHGIGVGDSGTLRSPFSPVPKLVVPGTHASGTIEPRERRTKSTLRALPERTSVVVDTAQIEIATLPEPTLAPGPALPDPAPQSPVIHVPIIQSPMAQSPVIPVPMEPSPSSESPAVGSATRITGEIQAAPSRKTARQMPAQARISIQLDTTLVPEPERAIAPAPETGGAPAVEPSSIRVTGEIMVAPSGKTARDTGRLERVSSSFQIDPSLPTEVPAKTQDRPTSPGDDRAIIATPQQRRQSGNFSPLEKDFFEREAELYQVDNAESFADLDENRGKAGDKNGPSKTPGRPHRK